MATESTATTSNYRVSPPPVPEIEHDSNQEVRVRRGELREWAEEVEHVMRTPIEAPGLWKSAGIGISVAALFFGGGLAVAYTGKNAPAPNPWIVVPALSLFVIGVLIFKFTEQLDKEVKKAGLDRTVMLANKIRHADIRTPVLSKDIDKT
jgi:hypothetical protein